MYATCLFCNGALGANEALEHFPVGRRIAYDSAKGRLWVVCRSCERWNLSPIETRWEAIEEAERAFRRTKVRVSTDNIGMAQLKGGMELVRIGKPIRTEFAAWRYGDQFGRRWRKYAVGSALVAAQPLGQLAYQTTIVTNVFWTHYSNTAVAVVSALGVSAMAVGSGFQIVRRRRDKKHVATVRDGAGQLLRLNHYWMDRSAITAPNNGRDWSLWLAHPRIIPPGNVRRMQGDPVRQQPLSDVAHTSFTGDSALRVLGTILPHINRSGGSKRQVSEAVNTITQADELASIITNAPVGRWTKSIYTKRWEKNLSTLPAAVRLALEMSLHESDERRAMEGELKELEQRWRDADAIAKIADEMFLPANVDQALKSLQTADDDAKARG